MQANKLSKYNTQTAPVQKKVEIVKGKPMLRTVELEKTLEPTLRKCGSKARNGNFDFAGLAG